MLDSLNRQGRYARYRMTGLVYCESNRSLYSTYTDFIGKIIGERLAIGMTLLIFKCIWAIFVLCLLYYYY